MSPTCGNSGNIPREEQTNVQIVNQYRVCSTFAICGNSPTNQAYVRLHTLMINNHIDGSISFVDIPRYWESVVRETPYGNDIQSKTVEDHDERLSQFIMIKFKINDDPKLVEAELDSLQLTPGGTTHVLSSNTKTVKRYLVFRAPEPVLRSNAYGVIANDKVREVYKALVEYYPDVCIKKLLMTDGDYDEKRCKIERRMAGKTYDGVFYKNDLVEQEVSITLMVKDIQQYSRELINIILKYAAN